MAYQFIKTEYLETISGGDKEIIRELSSMFREQIVEIAGEMKVCLAKRDYHSLGMLAHKAKSSVAIVGMSDLAIMLKTFESEGKEGKNIENYENYITRFEKETNQAAGELAIFARDL